MVFGLCNVLVIFEWLMENFLNGLFWKVCLVYFDDIIVFVKIFNEYLVNF